MSKSINTHSSDSDVNNTPAHDKSSYLTQRTENYSSYRVPNYMASYSATPRMPGTTSPGGMTSPRTPGTTTPSMPRTTTPGMPGTTTPSMPRTTTPGMPGTTTPQMPRTTTPGMPGTTTPQMPRTTTPGMPGTTTPSMPRTTTPGMPGTTTPSMPRTTTPGMPGPTAPGMPGTTTPSMPRTTTPGMPGTTTPGMPGTTTPRMPRTTTPGMPGTTTPGMPGTTTPGMPGTTTPSMPRTTTPGMPGTTAPGMPRTTTPGMPGTTTPGMPGTTAPGGMTTPGMQWYEFNQNQYQNIPYMFSPEYQGMQNTAPYSAPMGIPLFPIYGYDNSAELDKDIENMKRLYPSTVRAVEPYVTNECDQLEYDGSVMFDEFPDKVTIDRIVDRIYDNTKHLQEEADVEAEYMHPRRRRDNFRDIISVILLNEFLNRRRRYRSRRRWF